MDTNTTAALEAAGEGTPASAVPPAADAPATAAPAAPAARPVEDWAADKKTDPLWVTVAGQVERWCAGLEVTEDSYDAAIARVQGEVSR